jgi:hypothetical protein
MVMPNPFDPLTDPWRLKLKYHTKIYNSHESIYLQVDPKNSGIIGIPSPDGLIIPAHPKTMWPRRFVSQNAMKSQFTKGPPGLEDLQATIMD